MIPTKHRPFLCLCAAAALAAQGAAHAETRALTLSDAVTIALNANRSLVASRIDAEADQYALEAARSDFDLKVVPTASIGRIGDNTFAGAGGSNSSVGVQLRKKLPFGTMLAVGPSYNRFAGSSNSTLNVGVTQPLLKGFGRDVTLDGVRQAEYTAGSSGRGFRQASLNTALDAIGTYYEALKQRQLAELNDALVQRLKRHAEIARSKEQVGLASPMDTYRAGIRLKDAEDTANQAHDAYLTSLDRLKLILNLPLETQLLLQPPAPPELGVADPEGEALSNRIELEQLRAELTEARRAADVAGNALLPELNLQLNYGQTTTNDPVLAQYLPTTQRQWSVSLQASGDLARSAEKSNYRRAQLHADTVALNLETKTQDVQRQVRQQTLALEEARQRITLRQDQIKQAEGKLALAEVKFTHGMADNFDVIEAENELQQARSNLLVTEADYAVGIYNLKAMSGHLLDTAPLSRRGLEKQP